MDQVGRLRAHGEHRLGADVDAVSADGLQAQLATDPVAALEHADASCRHRVEQLERCSQAGDATAHDGDVRPGGRGLLGHVLSLSRDGDVPAPTLDGHGTGPGASRRAPLEPLGRRSVRVGGPVVVVVVVATTTGAPGLLGPAGAGSERPPETGSPTTPLTLSVVYEYASTAVAIASMLTSSASTLRLSSVSQAWW